MKMTMGLIAAALMLTCAGSANAGATKPAGLNAPGQEQQVDRRKKRVKGGSGCDDAHDVAEHPECR